MPRQDCPYFLARCLWVCHLILHALICRRHTHLVSLGGECRGGGSERKPAASTDGGPMKITPWYLAALAPFAAIGCSGAYLGHAAVVVLTIGIFYGTLSLGRAPAPAPKPPPNASA